MPLQVRKGHLSFRHFEVKPVKGGDNFEMSFTLGLNDLVSGVTFFFFSCISVRESCFPKTASEAKQRAPPGKTR